MPRGALILLQAAKQLPASHFFVLADLGLEEAVTNVLHTQEPHARAGLEVQPKLLIPCQPERGRGQRHAYRLPSFASAPAVNNPTFLRLRHSLRQVLMDLLFSVEFYFLFIFTQFPLLLGTIRDLILEPLMRSRSLRASRTSRLL